ncbi:hypothetical protein [Micromonospora sp. WMMD714]|uniref:hypothetical protein n=1 Tax=Micromonospora sp. WMMD714 TaxID=3016097 RepID=UPI00249A4A7F|nr:hypothetical protein [Micromonospora sp. WMMD714]WFE67236.1 hypothetical protein O7625_29855 [Micromonospora sp. WMMD714]
MGNSTTRPHETALVRSATPANIDTVLIDGRTVKQNRTLVSHDTAKVVRNAAAAHAIHARAGAAAHAIRTPAGGVLTPTSPTPPTF